MSLNFYKDKFVFNCLTQSIENAKQIYEITEGHCALGLLTSSYDTNESAIESMNEYSKILDGNISIGLGGGNPANSDRVIEVSKHVKANHINQIFTSVGITRAYSPTAFINALVSPTGQVGFVKINTGALSEKYNDCIAPVETAIAMAKEMGANSLKFFPMGGNKSIEELKYLAKACAKEDFGLEPTGGIDLNNYGDILKICYEQGVKRIIPHIYSSIIDKNTKMTDIDKVSQIYKITKEIIK